MFERNFLSKNSLMAVIASACAFTLSSCSSGVNNGTAQVTPQGTVQLENLKAGVPESVFKDAIITFVPDSKPQASANGKTQYISRGVTKTGGQYVAQCKDGRCFGLEVVFQNNPIDKEQAVTTLKMILPPDAGEETKVSDKSMKSGKGNNEFHYFGDKATGVFLFTDPSASKVQKVTCFILPGEAVEEAYAGKPEKANKALAERKSPEEEAVAGAAKPATETSTAQ
ncbi:MAG TPA: hypothetical protein V6C72_03695 [Chroococcales cyanobacterium]